MMKSSRFKAQGSKFIGSVWFWRVTTLLLASFAIFASFFPVPSSQEHLKALSDKSVVNKALAAEIYPEFGCPCCGQPLNKEEPCCGLMQEMIDFIDQKVGEGLDRQEVELATVKQFGLERLISEEKQEEVKKLLLAKAPQDAPKIGLETKVKDLGEVSTAQGEISTDFEITNNGQSDLLIDKLSSSCGCTSAAIIYRGQEGPRFYMAGHGQENPKNWQVAIAPGAQAILRVYYDPTVHPDLVGAVTRTVSIHSNDPVDFETKLTITLEQMN